MHSDSCLWSCSTKSACPWIKTFAGFLCQQAWFVLWNMGAFKMIVSFTLGSFSTEPWVHWARCFSSYFTLTTGTETKHIWYLYVKSYTCMSHINWIRSSKAGKYPFPATSTEPEISDFWEVFGCFSAGESGPWCSRPDGAVRGQIKVLWWEIGMLRIGHTLPIFAAPFVCTSYRQTQSLEHPFVRREWPLQKADSKCFNIDHWPLIIAVWLAPGTMETLTLKLMRKTWNWTFRWFSGLVRDFFGFPM